MEAIINFWHDTGFYMIGNDWRVLVMMCISFVLLYLAIVKGFEPLLLIPIGFGMLLTNGGICLKKPPTGGLHLHPNNNL